MLTELKGQPKSPASLKKLKNPTEKFETDLIHIIYIYSNFQTRNFNNNLRGKDREREFTRAI